MLKILEPVKPEPIFGSYKCPSCGATSEICVSVDTVAVGCHFCGAPLTEPFEDFKLSIERANQQTQKNKLIYDEAKKSKADKAEEEERLKKEKAERKAVRNEQTINIIMQVFALLFLGFIIYSIIPK